MKDPAFDETDIKCPICRRVYKGKYVANPYETQGICDWCALGLMLKKPEVTQVAESN